MEVNADFTQRILVQAETLAWLPSPTVGVERRMLDRIGVEVARATSIVRYAPGSLFPAHTHDGGEEFIVLEGVFQDEHGDYPAGTYVRNPPTTRHRPGSSVGCTIFVKLWQFDPADRTAVVWDMNAIELRPVPDRAGLSTAELFKDHREEVRLEHWGPGAEVSFACPQGAELLLLDGSCMECGEPMQRLSWLRIPDGGRLTATAGPNGARIWIKLGGVGYNPIAAFAGGQR